MLEESQWLTSKLRLAVESLLYLLGQTNGLLHRVHLKVNFIDAYNKAFFAWFGLIMLFG